MMMLERKTFFLKELSEAQNEDLSDIREYKNYWVEQNKSRKY